MTRDEVIIELTILACHKPKWLTKRQNKAISEAQRLLRQLPLERKGDGL